MQNKNYCSIFTRRDNKRNISNYRLKQAIKNKGTHITHVTPNGVNIPGVVGVHVVHGAVVCHFSRWQNATGERKLRCGDS